MIQIDAGDQTSLGALLALLSEKEGEVMIRRDGTLVAKLVGIKPPVVNRFSQDPRLGVVFHESPMLPLPDEEWSEDGN
jgi:hypothetical protein